MDMVDEVIVPFCWMNRKEVKPGVTEIEFILNGKKSDWLPELEKASTPFNEIHRYYLLQDAQALPDRLDKPHSLSVFNDENSTRAPEDAIKNISEIPGLLENTELPAVHLTGQVAGIARSVVLVGEVHIATKEESRAAKRIIPYFSCIGIESVDVRGFISGRIFNSFLDKITYPIVNVITKRSSKNKSLIDIAYSFVFADQKQVMPLEKGWKPGLRTRIFFVGFPLLFMYAVVSFVRNMKKATRELNPRVILNLVVYFILERIVTKIAKLVGLSHIFSLSRLFAWVTDLGPSRNRNMIRNTIGFLTENRDETSMLILTGRAHTKDMASILCDKHGFVDIGFN